jgi:hypothetical protein
LQAIETAYSGCRFRSRLEARWAVFFGVLGVRYHYEPQGFDLGGVLGAYLPDFWLPPQSGFRGGYVEIKGAVPTDREWEKAWWLGLGAGQTVYVFAGGVELPDPAYDPPANCAAVVLPGGIADYPHAWCECHLCGAVGIEYEGRGARLACGCDHGRWCRSNKCRNHTSSKLHRASA